MNASLYNIQHLALIMYFSSLKLGRRCFVCVYIAYHYHYYSSYLGELKKKEASMLKFSEHVVLYAILFVGKGTCL